MNILENKSSLKAWVADVKQNGETIGLVPTMGALHDGHISLIEAIRPLVDRVAASVFVNPLQFGPNEDFSAYPRTREADVARLHAAGCDAAYFPEITDLYPEGFATAVTVGEWGTILCGAFRPGHFDGVATVVTKLLLQAEADHAIFGEKDFQQIRVIERTVSDLDIPCFIHRGPTKREADGLAMSSRNAYLSPAERVVAPALYRVLTATASRIRNGEAVGDALKSGIQEITDAGFKSVDYLEYRVDDTLAPLEQYVPNGRLFVAARLGKARLIDNLAV